ncbi:beta-1,3-galactosyltransferase 1-like isoform X2 [Octopus sinensis]|uniref:Hexosyltransferase n=1 Tax=Octopus sinensis TaxID=2607531 RepID=A0A7E6EWB7_9MOLL|nr:beta-1,3-galactosyltransferase 1-like isoform X2 [Octopus sinensis]XP_036359633.1 beta-1,3-galactosyltransferase 1-like isoform X2 [Octopus sinensis]
MYLKKKTLITICILLYVYWIFHDAFHSPKDHSLTYFNERRETLKNTEIILQSQPKGSKVDKRYYDNPQPYEYDFKNLINEPVLCSQYEKVFLLYTVRTIYSHLDRRKVLRKIFQDIPYDSFSKDIVVKHVFLFANTNNYTTESLIREESRIYRDIIQDDFPESYGNVYLKTLMAWKWSVEFCANVEYVMVLNDELFVDQIKLLPFLHYDLSQADYDNKFAFCYCFGGRELMHNKLKKFRKLGEKMLYQGENYPIYCHGVGYIAHINVINKLYLASLKNKMLMPDDVWNGVLSEKLGIKQNCQNHRVQASKYFGSILKSYWKNPFLVAVCDHDNRPEAAVPCLQGIYKSVSKLRNNSNVHNRLQ